MPEKTFWVVLVLLIFILSFYSVILNKMLIIETVDHTVTYRLENKADE